MAVAVRQQTEKTKTRRYRRARKQHMCRRPAFQCLAIGLVLAGLIGYVGLYAKITQHGYTRARLMNEYKQAKMENQYLRAEQRMLACPDRLAEAAQKAGMVQSELVPGKDVQFLNTPRVVRVAKADGSE